jgi:cellulose synthase (UDP-forming)
MRKTPFITYVIIFAVIAGIALAAFTVIAPSMSGPLATAFSSSSGAVATGASSTATIADAAFSYNGSMTRPLMPETAALLPFGLQIAISALLFFAMLIVARFMPNNRGLIMLLTIVCVARHLVWRIVDTMPQNAPMAVNIVAYTIYGAEILAFISLVLGYFQIYKLTNRKPVRLPMDLANHLPAVDVMVCTYNEPVSVLYRTLVGCQAIDYPNKRVFLLDDGSRPEMAQLAERLGVNYISRPSNEHAKAGNLNNALRQTNGDLVLVFDADHVPCKSFLQEVVGFFLQDDRLAFVQTPQHFFTIDPFQRNLVAEEVANNEQDLFFHIIEPGNDHWGACFFAGSGAIFRRNALAQIGGFAVETITEDVHTGLRLHARGWRSAFYNKDLAAGLAQDSFADFVKQRLRWARGMTQIFFNDHPLLVGGLSMAQRLCYFAGIWYFFNGLHRMIFLLAPLAFLLFGMMTINAGFIEVLTFYLPSFVCLFLGYTILTKGYRHSFWSEVYETATCFYLTFATIGTCLSPGRSKFMVTPKGGVSDKITFNWQIVVPQIVIATLTIVGLVWAVMRSVYTPEYLGGIFTNFFWSAYNLVLLIGAIYVAQERPQYRLAPRISKRIRCELRLLDGTIAVGYTTNLSESGVAIVFDEPIPVAGTMALKILDWDINESTVLNVQAVRSTLDQSNRHYVGFRVVNRTELQHRKLIRHMFGSSGVWQHDYEDAKPSKALLNLMNLPFRLAGTTEEAKRRRTPRFQAALPCVLETEMGGANGVSNELSETGMSLTVAANEVALGLEQRVRVRLQWSNGHISALTALVKRLESAPQNQVRVSLNFVELDRQQRLELIQQIYGPREGLIRVAPPVTRMVQCQLLRQNGQQIRGFSQEISEMGVRIVLEGRPDVQAQETVMVQFHWEDHTTSRFAGVIVGADPGNGTPNSASAIVYFRNTDLQALDGLSRKLHEPMLAEALG